MGKEQTQLGVRINHEMAKQLRIEAIKKDTSVARMVEGLLESSLIDTSFDQWTRQASRVLVVGLTLHETTQRFGSVWRYRLEEGCCLQFVVLNPQAPVLPFIAYRTGQTENQMREEINASLGVFKQLATYNAASGQGSLEVRQADFLLPLSAAKVISSKIQMRIDTWPFAENRLSRTLCEGDELFHSLNPQVEGIWNDSKVCLSSDATQTNKSRL